MLREGLLQPWWMLFRHSKIIGQRTDIYRNMEDSYAVKQGEPTLSANSVYLDIGSGSSLVPTFLYRRRGPTTYATELDPTYLKRQQGYAKILGFSKSDRFHVRAEDATRLTFANDSLDFITAISTIEHIPGDGDTRSMREFARTLRSGGRVVVTVPTSASYEENDSTSYYYGFERRYDAVALQQRLGEPALQLVDELYLVSPSEDFVQEVRKQFSETFAGKNPLQEWYEKKWHDQYPDVSIVWTLGMIRLSTDPSGSFGAMLTFEKR
jgi:SAM-dependent methyltransferase